MQLQFDTTTPTQVKTGGPLKKPPKVLPFNKKPRRHDVVAWRHDGGLDARQFETKESAQEYGRELCWAVYYKWALMEGRHMVERHDIAVPEGMAINDDGLPCEA